MLTGRATPEGTARFAARASTAAPGHFRDLTGAGRLSSLGLGTYLGPDDDATDALYRRAVGRAVERGVNVLDTAVNYRNQRSERAVGAALADLVRRGAVQRDEVVIATKGGYIPLDAGAALDARAYVTETYLKTGLIRAGEVVGGAHCMTPRFLADQIERSRTNLGLETIDVYYLHNPESQLEEVERADFLARMRAAFGALEAAAADGRIGCYGTATWNGYRQAPGARDHLGLEELVGLARELAGDGHHFKVIQLPYNLGMPEAYTRASQPLRGRTVPLLEAAAALGLYAMASASVHQGQLTRNQPPIFSELVPGLDSDAQRALQFVRSTPGIGTALVGMKSVAHVDENTAVAAAAPMTEAEFRKLFTDA
jgi:aryl-alcohol dehydrogenase-like predicted oxidoreductase